VAWASVLYLDLYIAQSLVGVSWHDDTPAVDLSI